MAVYMIVEIQAVNAVMYAEYVRKVRSVVEAHGGRYLARGGRVLFLSGDWKPERLILIAFTSFEQVERCLASPEYRELAPLREASTRSRAIVVEGYEGGDRDLTCAVP